MSDGMEQLALSLARKTVCLVFVTSQVEYVWDVLQAIKESHAMKARI